MKAMLKNMNKGYKQCYQSLPQSARLKEEAAVYLYALRNINYFKISIKFICCSQTGSRKENATHLGNLILNSTGVAVVQLYSWCKSAVDLVPVPS